MSSQVQESLASQAVASLEGRASPVAPSRSARFSNKVVELRDGCGNALTSFFSKYVTPLASWVGSKAVVGAKWIGKRPGKIANVAKAMFKAIRDSFRTLRTPAPKDFHEGNQNHIPARHGANKFYSQKERPEAQKAIKQAYQEVLENSDKIINSKKKVHKSLEVLDQRLRGEGNRRAQELKNKSSEEMMNLYGTKESFGIRQLLETEMHSWFGEALNPLYTLGRSEQEYIHNHASDVIFKAIVDTLKGQKTHLQEQIKKEYRETVNVDSKAAEQNVKDSLRRAQQRELLGREEAADVRLGVGVELVLKESGADTEKDPDSIQRVARRMKVSVQELTGAVAKARAKIEIEMSALKKETAPSAPVEREGEPSVFEIKDEVENEEISQQAAAALEGQREAAANGLKTQLNEIANMQEQLAESQTILNQSYDRRKLIAQLLIESEGKKYSTQELRKLPQDILVKMLNGSFDIVEELDQIETEIRNRILKNSELSYAIKGKFEEYEQSKNTSYDLLDTDRKEEIDTLFGMIQKRETALQMRADELLVKEQEKTHAEGSVQAIRNTLSRSKKIGENSSEEKVSSQVSEKQAESSTEEDEVASQVSEDESEYESGEVNEYKSKHETDEISDDGEVGDDESDEVSEDDEPNFGKDAARLEGQKGWFGSLRGLWSSAERV